MPRLYHAGSRSEQLGSGAPEQVDRPGGVAGGQPLGAFVEQGVGVSLRLPGVGQRLGVALAFLGVGIEVEHDGLKPRAIGRLGQ